VAKPRSWRLGNPCPLVDQPWLIKALRSRVRNADLFETLGYRHLGLVLLSVPLTSEFMSFAAADEMRRGTASCLTFGSLELRHRRNSC